MTPVQVFLALVLSFIPFLGRMALERNNTIDFAIVAFIGSFIGTLGATVAMSPIVIYGKVEIFLILLSGYFVSDIAHRLFFSRPC